MYEPFKFLGHIENNVVVPDDSVELPNGTKVEVYVVGSGQAAETEEQRRTRILRAHELLFEASKGFRLPPGFVFDRDLANERNFG